MSGLITPVRLRLSRQRGFSLQAASIAVNGLPAICVARPSRWGNPWVIAKARELGFEGADDELAAMCVGLFHNAIMRSLSAAPAIGEIRSALAGHNLACWCRPDAPCHADVLLAIANAG